MSKRSGISSVAVIMIGAIAGIGGYFLGQGEAPTKMDATEERSTAMRKAFKASFPEALATGKKAGSKVGIKQGQRAGEKQGTRRGESTGTEDVDAEKARLAASAAAAAQAAAAAEAAQRAAEATAMYGTNIPPDAPSTCPPGYHFANEFSDACVPD